MWETTPMPTNPCTLTSGTWPMIVVIGRLRRSSGAFHVALPLETHISVQETYTGSSKPTNEGESGFAERAVQPKGDVQYPSLTAMEGLNKWKSQLSFILGKESMLRSPSNEYVMDSQTQG